MSFPPELTESDNATALFSHSLVVDCHVNVGGHMRAQLVLDKANNTKWTFSTTPYLEGLEGISEATRSTITNHVHTHTCSHINMHRHTLMHIHFHIQETKEHCVSLTELLSRGDFLCLYKQCLTQYTYIPTPCVSQCQQPTHISSQQHEDAIITPFSG